MLINYDDKWFFGWICHVNAKKCELLGLDKTHTYLYHKGNIDKVMAVALTGFAFDGNMENGVVGVKLGIYRVQGAQLAKKTVRKIRRDGEGKIKYNGEIMRKKGDAYMVNCTVKGADTGTSDAPKFSLKYMFEEHTFPKISMLVASGGDFEGYLPVFQGNNKGPHICAIFHNYMKKYCTSMGWKWEPQAPQMPHMNNHDLSIFPATSKRRSALLKA